MKIIFDPNKYAQADNARPSSVSVQLLRDRASHVSSHVCLLRQKIDKKAEVLQSTPEKNKVLLHCIIQADNERTVAACCQTSPQHAFSHPPPPPPFGAHVIALSLFFRAGVGGRKGIHLAHKWASLEKDGHLSLEHAGLFSSPRRPSATHPTSFIHLFRNCGVILSQVAVLLPIRPLTYVYSDVILSRQSDTECDSSGEYKGPGLESGVVRGPSIRIKEHPNFRKCCLPPHSSNVCQKKTNRKCKS